MLENCDKIMHLRFNFDACPVHSSFGFVLLMHQNLSACAFFGHNSLTKVNMQFAIKSLLKIPNYVDLLLQCLQVFLERANITSDAYHLRRTNWCQEPAGLLTDVVRYCAFILVLL